MSRSIDRGDGERLRRENAQNGPALGRGQGGGICFYVSGRPPREDRVKHPRAHGASFNAEIAELVDQAAADKPTMSQLVERLEKDGIVVVPSIQSNGRLNGMSYRFKGSILKGSQLGRDYTTSESIGCTRLSRLELSARAEQSNALFWTLS